MDDRWCGHDKWKKILQRLGTGKAEWWATVEEVAVGYTDLEVSREARSFSYTAGGQTCGKW